MKMYDFPRLHSDFLKSKADLNQLKQLLNRTKDQYLMEMKKLTFISWQKRLLNRLIMAITFEKIDTLKNFKANIEKERLEIQRKYYGLSDEIQKEIIEVSENILDLSDIDRRFIIELKSHLCESGYPVNWDEVSRDIRERDNFQCKLCGAFDRIIHVHHIIPLSRGGSNSYSNLISLCEKCHSSKHPHMRSQ